MKQYLVSIAFSAVAAHVPAGHDQAPAQAPQKAGQAQAEAPASGAAGAAKAPGSHQLSQQERALLRKQLYQYSRLAGKGS